MTQFVRCTCILLALGLTGCQVYRFVPTESPAPAGMASYAEHLMTLNADERRQALKTARGKWQSMPTPTTRARMGLARGQWGHPGYDPAAAAEDLKAALADEGAEWSAYDRAFLSLRAAQLRQVVARQSQHNELAQENDRLRKNLKEAERKLRAISEIERKLGPE